MEIIYEIRKAIGVQALFPHTHTPSVIFNFSLGITEQESDQELCSSCILCGFTYSTLMDSIKLGFEIFFFTVRYASYVNI